MRALVDRTCTRLTQSTWNTTIDSIIPLPNSADTLPSEEYAIGTRVLALYPDTSCFYWATVQGGGPNTQAHTLRSKVGRFY